MLQKDWRYTPKILHYLLLLNQNITSLNITRQDLTIIENLDVFGNLSVDTNTLFVDSNLNKVGIGTDSPSASLEINGTGGEMVKITGTNEGHAYLIISDGTGGGKDFKAGTDHHIGPQFGGVGVAGLAFPNAGDIVPWVSNARYNWGRTGATYRWGTFFINSLQAENASQDNYFAGNVGINTTTPQNTLNVIGDLNVTGKIYNSLAHAFGLATVVHTVASAGVWYNITMNRSHADATGFVLSEDNITMIVPHDGHYTITFGMGIMDSAVTPGADVGMRVFVNEAELLGSYIEDDTQKKDADKWQEHTTHAVLSTGDRIQLQYIASELTVTIEQEDTYATQGFSAFGYLQEVMT